MVRVCRNLWPAVVVWACASTPEHADAPRACTRIGCESGLGIRVEGATGPVRIELDTGEGAEVREAECAPDRPCVAFFPGRTPDSATVRVVAGPRVVTRELRPEYERVRPNGPGCPPVCRQATVVVALPGD